MNDGRTACVIGWPILHSRSPIIHGYWLRRHAIAGSYVKHAVAPGELADFLSRMENDGIVGGNATVPHKVELLRLADEASEVARTIGAANTFWREDGKLRVTNTDAYGFLAHLDAEQPGWRGRDEPVLVVGAGGAARAVVQALLTAGVGRIVVANRSPGRAEELVAHFGPCVRVTNLPGMPEAASTCGLLVNTTTLGMEGKGAEEGAEAMQLLLEAVGRLRPAAIVYDIVYVPLRTRLLAAAEARGLATVDGLGMLLHQAVPGFERWFGVRPVVDEALRELVVADLAGDAA
ncbi:MAG: shikimate dehydrogenase [Rhizobiales bacterium]|nr:shikimate dehydrogenase [Hyphomicrobiales bacterium]